MLKAEFNEPFYRALENKNAEGCVDSEEVGL